MHLHMRSWGGGLALHPELEMDADGMDMGGGPTVD